MIKPDTSILFILILYSLFFYSCTCDRSTKNDELKNETEISFEPFRTGSAQGDSVLFLIPSPGDIIERFNEVNIQFNRDLINPASNRNLYPGTMEKSLNLGVYITDMAYLTLFERASESIEYLETIQALSYEVGVSSGMFETILNRAKSNTGQLDSLFNISNEAYADLIEFLESGERNNVVILITSGAYVESLYILMNSLPESYQNELFRQLLSDMRYPFYNIYERAERMSDDDNIQILLRLLSPLKEIFDASAGSDTDVLIKSKQKGEITIQGGKKGIINDTELDKLRSQILKIRNEITG
jgi:hypothetical protein